MLILGRADLEAVLEPREVVDALGRAFADHAAGRFQVPPRAISSVTDDGLLLLMPASGPGGDGLALGTKLVAYYTENQRRGLPTIHSTYILMDGATGRPLALLEGGFLTGLRTGATSALAARYLARKDARTLLCFGAGVQAGFQLQCLAAVLPIERVTVVGRDPERARRFVAEWSARLGKPVELAASGDAHVATADVITCATTATTPLFDGRRLKAGTHVDAVGTFQATDREVDAETVRRARVVVDQPATTDNAGDIALPSGMASSRGRTWSAILPPSSAARSRAARNPTRSRCSSPKASRSKTSRPPASRTRTRRRAGSGARWSSSRGISWLRTIS